MGLLVICLEAHEGTNEHSSLSQIKSPRLTRIHYFQRNHWSRIRVCCKYYYIFDLLGGLKSEFYYRYTAENSVKFGAPRDTDHPGLRQPLALEIWDSVVKSLVPGSKITILTNGPLTTLAKIILSDKNMSALIQVS